MAEKKVIAKIEWATPVQFRMGIDVVINIYKVINSLTNTDIH